LPHIIPIITSYKIKDKEAKLLNDVSGLYNWYYSMVKDINQQPTDKALVTLVDEITKDNKTDLEKVRSIYYWTQQNIKYIAFEYALGGFIPREANDVFNKKYGDCKDNSSILYEMLKVAGLKGHLTWIGTREIPYSYTDVPTPIVDNHMILSYQ
jgi:transglutaminase-like putative cysteine protease